MIKKVSKHIVQEEPLLFELSSPGKLGYQLPELDVPAVDAKAALGEKNVRSGNRRFPGSERIRSGASLYQAFDLELRHRFGPLSARFVHDEIQSARK